ncbi:MAG: hypothetical protein ACT4NT_07335 [Nitrososphaerota archaeon]
MLGHNDDLHYSSARKICKNILETNFKIRSASICKDDGVIMCSDHRKDIESLSTHHEGQASLVQAASRFFNRKLSEKNFGKTMFTLTVHEKVARITIPLNNRYVVLISADTDANHTELVKSYICPVLSQ